MNVIFKQTLNYQVTLVYVRPTLCIVETTRTKINHRNHSFGVKLYQETEATVDSYCSGTGQLRESFLQSPAIVVFIQLNHFVRGTNFIKHILGHFAVRTGGLGEYHHTVLRHDFLKFRRKQDKIPLNHEWKECQRVSQYEVHNQPFHPRALTWTYCKQFGLDPVVEDVKFPILTFKEESTTCEHGEVLNSTGFQCNTAHPGYGNNLRKEKASQTNW